jgi:DNA-directed RNA polymerase subunit RPC12/RpoP
MVRIVKVEPHPSVVKEVVCRSCGATLEYVPKEVQTRTWMDYSGDNNIVDYIACPNCSSEVKVKEY